MKYPQKELKRALQAKGFQIDVKKRDHWATFYYHENPTRFKCRIGGQSRKTYKMLGDDITHEIRFQLGFDGVILDRKLFIDFINCPFKENDYISELKKAGYLIDDNEQ